MQRLYRITIVSVNEFKKKNAGGPLIGGQLVLYLHADLMLGPPISQNNGKILIRHGPGYGKSSDLQIWGCIEIYLAGKIPSYRFSEPLYL